MFWRKKANDFPMYKKFVRNISFPIIARRNGLTGLYEKIHGLEESQYWSKEKLDELQIRKLRQLLIHARDHVPYYKDLFGDSGFRPESLVAIEDLKSIPLLDKKIIRQQKDRLLARSFASRELHFSETGGTTGVKMKFYRDNKCLSAKEALRFRFEKWAGWEIGESMGLVWPATVDYVGHHTWKAKIKNALYERQVVFPAAVLEEPGIQDFIRRAVKGKIVFIRAFTSPLYSIAHYLLDKGQRLPVKGIVTTGEPLFPHQRNVLAKAFDCKVLDSYRCREVGPVAQQCSEGKGMHVNMESIILEVERQDDLPGQQGKIVVTDLENYGMPLIRYNMDDIGELSNEICSCGRTLQMINTLSGRAADSFVTPDGRQVMAGSLVLYLVDEAPGMVGQVQVVQDKVDHLIIRMTPDPPPTEDIKSYQKEKVKQLFGNSMDVDFEIVSEISRSKSGKYQFAVCQVKNEEQES